MYRIGLTGSIGVGKSTVASYLESREYPVIYADKLGHEAYLPDTRGFQRVIEAFGREVIDSDGYINRKYLGNIVFADPKQLQRLNDIVWPEIQRLAKSRMEQLQKSNRHSVVFLEAAVLLEANWDTEVDEVWTVLAHSTNALQRVVERDRTTETRFKQRLTGQLSNAERKARSDIVIENDSTIEDLYARIDAELVRLRRRLSVEGNATK